MRTHLRTVAGIIGLVAIIAAAFVVWRDASAYTNFDPCGVTQLSSTAANAPSDIDTTFGVGLDTSTCTPFISATDRPGQWNAGQVIHFTPPEWTVASDADIADGTQVGTLNSKAVLGIFDNGCNVILPVNFTLFEGTTNTAGATVDEKPLGMPDRLSPMGPANAPAAAAAWPTYLNDVATAFGMNLSQLLARYVGVNTSSIAGTTVVVNYLVFQPGATVSSSFNIDPLLGYPTLVILQDPSSATSSLDPVSDFCAPLWTQLQLDGVIDGDTFRGNPGDGAYNFITFAAPEPDADDDGIENNLDPCPLTANASGWDPRAHFFPVSNNTGDMDGDALPDDCDPFPTEPSACTANVGISNSDEDCDGWQNRLDNCPINANSGQQDADHDDIGDACDPDPTIFSGAHPSGCIVNTVFVGSGGTAQPDPFSLYPCSTFDRTPTPTALPPTVPATPTPTLPSTPTSTPVASITPTPAPTGETVGPSATSTSTPAPTKTSHPTPSPRPTISPPHPQGCAPHPWFLWRVRCHFQHHGWYWFSWWWWR